MQRPPHRNPLLFLIVSVIAVIGLMFSPGCAADDIAVAKVAIPQVQAEVAKTQVALEHAQQEIVIAKEAGQDTAKAEAVVDVMHKALSAAQTTLAKLNAIVASATSTADLIEAGSKEASVLVPGVYGALVAMTGTTIAALIRAGQNREAARNIAYSIEQAKEQGKIDFGSPETAAKLSANMGARAKRIVDEAQGDRTPLPI